MTDAELRDELAALRADLSALAAWLESELCGPRIASQIEIGVLRRRIDAMGLTLDAVLVSIEDLQRHKPHPELDR